MQQYLQTVRAYEKSCLKRGDEYDKEWREMQQRYPTVRAILWSLGAESQEFEPDDDEDLIKTVVLRGLGILEDRAFLSSKLAPDAPVLAADRMHSWVLGGGAAVMGDPAVSASTPRCGDRHQCPVAGQGRPPRHIRRQIGPGMLQRERARTGEATTPGSW